MAYTHVQREVMVAQAQSTASLAVIARYPSVLQPYILRQVGVLFTTAAAAAGILLIKKRPTAGSTSGETTIGTINFDATTGAQGKVVYLDDIYTKFVPGDDCVFEITDVAASGVVDIKVLLEESWESPRNLTDMAATV